MLDCRQLLQRPEKAVNIQRSPQAAVNQTVQPIEGAKPLGPIVFAAGSIFMAIATILTSKGNAILGLKRTPKFVRKLMNL